MNKKAVLLWIISFILLTACGGGSETEPDTTTDDNTGSATTTETTDQEDSTSADSEEMEEAEESDEESEAMDEEEAVEAETDDGSASNESTEETTASASPFGDRPMTGTDPETGLAVNPETVRPGDTFIVRGEIISMNLTPTTAPEFLIQSPDGLKFRLRSQDLADTYFEDGDQLQAFEYRNGLLAQATATLAADASPSDIPTSDDLTLIPEE